MKKIFFLIFSMVAFFSTNVNAQNDLKVNENLVNSKKFIALVQATHNLNSFIIKAIKDNGLDLEDVKKQIEQLQGRNLDAEEQFVELNKIFKTDVREAFNAHQELFVSNWNEIQESIKGTAPDILNNTCQKVCTTLNFFGPAEGSGGCGWKFYVCAAAAYSAAILCHSGCTASTAGFGLPACIFLCGSIEASAILVCERNFC